MRYKFGLGFIGVEPIRGRWQYLKRYVLER